MSNEAVTIITGLSISVIGIFIFIVRYVRLKLRIAYLQGKEDALKEMNK